jgi:hypothetical protein
MDVPYIRLEKSALLEDALPTPCSKKDISLYTEYADTPGLSNQPDKIVVRSSHNLSLFVSAVA